MGATEFMARAEGVDATSAFRAAREEAAWEHGHGGYTGTIAEKQTFAMIRVPDVVGLPTAAAAVAYARHLIDEDDRRIRDKWGPAGCIEYVNDVAPGKRAFLFFGWASQ